MTARMHKQPGRKPAGVVGYTHDGVAILRPKVKSNRFTIAEAREIFRKLRSRDEPDSHGAKTRDSAR
jgi:hypothetical protein